VLVFLQLERMRLEDRIREIMRFKHYSLSTEESYVGWYRRFVRFHQMRHPQEMGAAEVEAVMGKLLYGCGLRVKDPVNHPPVVSRAGSIELTGVP
jgi:hypothetical protein